MATHTPERADTNKRAQTARTHTVIYQPSQSVIDRSPGIDMHSWSLVYWCSSKNGNTHPGERTQAHKAPTHTVIPHSLGGAKQPHARAGVHTYMYLKNLRFCHTQSA